MSGPKRHRATILPFPKRPVRWWAVRELRQQPGTWKGFLYNCGSDEPNCTDAGALWLVIDALKRHEPRLPIVVRPSREREAA
jgi:hypothetical protein